MKQNGIFLPTKKEIQSDWNIPKFTFSILLKLFFILRERDIKKHPTKIANKLENSCDTPTLCQDSVFLVGETNQGERERENKL